MKKLLYLFIALCVLACKNDSNNFSDFSANKISASDLNDDRDSSKNEIYKPLFLTLNPEMPDDLFQYKLKSLSPDKAFIIPVKNLNLPFNIEKGENRIILKFSNIATKTFSDKFGENAEFRFQEFINNEKSRENGEKIILGLIEIFQKKYPKKIENLPLVKNQNGNYYNPSSEIYSDLKGIRLMDYDFRKENYLIFQDTIKTVLVGFSNLELKREISDQDKKLAFHNSNPAISQNGSTKSYDQIREYLRNTSDYQLALVRTKFEDPITKEEGYELEVNYLFNSDFKSLTDKIKEKYIELHSGLQTIDSLADIKKSLINENLEKL